MPTNFLQWNPTQSNQESDAAYSSDAQRVGGAPTNTPFPSATANKLFYQTTTGITALMEMMSAKGYTVNDTNIATLASTLAALLTTADFPNPLTQLLFVSNATKTISNGAGRTSIVPTGLGSMTIPANTVGVGSTFRLTTYSQINVAGGGNAFFSQVDIGGITFSQQNGTYSAVSDIPDKLEVIFTCTAISSGLATFIISGIESIGSPPYSVQIPFINPSGTFSVSSANLIDVTIDWFNTTNTASYISYMVTLERLR